MAKADVIAIMQADQCTKSEKNGTIVNGIIQDAVLGLYRMTQNEVRLPMVDWQQCVSAINLSTEGIQSLLARGKESTLSSLYSGKMLASSLFPAGFNYTKASGNNKVEIVNGILLQGVLDKATIFSDQGSILQKMHKQFGANEALFFQENSYPLVQQYFELTGFSFDYNDCRLEPELNAKVQNVIDSSRREIASIQGTVGDPRYESIVSAKINNMKARVDRMVLENTDKQEMRINREGTTSVIGIYATYVGTGRMYLPHADVSSIVLNYNAKYAYWLNHEGERKNMDVQGLISVTAQYQSISSKGGIDMHMDTRWWFKQNPFLSHTESGSKGNFNNFVQAVAMVGQQYLGSERIPAQLANNRVMLPHFRVGDNDPITRGLGNLPYSVGVHQRQHFASAIAARKATTSTLTATPVTGYGNRKLTKLMEVNVAQYDLTVRATPYAFTNTRGEKVVAGKEVATSSGNKILVGGPIVQFIYGDMGFAVDKTLKLSGVPTFTDLQQNVKNMLMARETQKKRFAYFMVVEKRDYVSALVSLFSLDRVIGTEERRIIDVVVAFDSSIPYTVQTVIKALATKAFSFTPNRSRPSTLITPVWAHNLVEYERVIVIDAYLVSVRSTTNLFMDIPSDVPAVTISLPPGIVTADTPMQIVSGLAIIQPQGGEGINVNSSQEGGVDDWGSEMMAASGVDDFTPLSSSVYAVDGFTQTTKEQEKEIVSILFSPLILSINETTTRSTELWDRILTTLMDRFPSLSKITTFAKAQ